MTSPLSNYSLMMSTPAIQGISPIMSLDGIARNWQRSIRLNGGFWTGSFEVVADPDTLVSYYESWLGNHISETSGGVPTWEGLVYELELQSSNLARRKTFDDMTNRVACNYKDDRTSFANNTASRNFYGTKADVLDYGGTDEDGADQMRDTYLKRYAWPISNPVGPVTSYSPASLRVLVCGYIFTVNWQFATLNEENNISDMISSLINGDVELVTIGKIDTNSQSISLEANVSDVDQIPQRVWDLIADDMLPVGDEDGDIWRFYVDLDQLCYYNELSMTPAYYVSEGTVRYSSSQDLDVPPWLLGPGVYRDLDFRTIGQEQDSIYLDARDFIVEEVEVSDTGGIALKSLGYDDSAFIASLNTYSQLSSGDGDNDHEMKWRWGDMSDEQRDWWSNGRVGPAPG